MISECLDSGLIRRGRQQKTVVDKWHFDRGHVQYSSQSRESGHVKKRYFPPIIIKLVDGLIWEELWKQLLLDCPAFVASFCSKLCPCSNHLFFSFVHCCMRRMGGLRSCSRSETNFEPRIRLAFK